MKDRLLTATLTAGTRNRLANAVTAGSERTCTPTEAAAERLKRALADHRTAQLGLAGAAGDKAHQRGAADSALTLACADLLERVPDIRRLHDAKEEPKLVRSALETLYANSDRLKHANRIMKGQALNLLGEMEALERVEHLVHSVRTVKKDGPLRPTLLASALGDVYVIAESGRDAHLASTAASIICEGKNRRARLAARLAKASLEGGQIDISARLVCSARENIKRLDEEAAVPRNDRIAQRNHEQTITNIRGSYGDLLILSKTGQDDELVRKTLGHLLSHDVDACTRLAAEILLARLGRGEQA